MARPKEFDRTKTVDKALEIFWCKGYEATSVQDLLDAMEINRGSMYDTFHDKYSLYVEALSRYEATEAAPLFAVLNEPMTGRAAIDQFFDTLLDEITHDTKRKGCFVVNTIIELAPHDKALHHRVQAILASGEASFERTIRRGQQDGSINAAADAIQMARLLNNTVQGMRVLGKVNPDRAMLHDVAAAALNALK
ncbi:MAG: TetR family transcriptional regulator [bacterium]|nr:TetR family transcriptional regulator [bacterium]